MQQDTTIDFFSEILPPEVTHAILSYLAPIDIVNASVVSKTFAGLLDTRGIWKRIVNEQFGPLDEEIFRGNNINWKRTYHRGCELLRFKKQFLVSQMSRYTYSTSWPKRTLPSEKYSTVYNVPNSLIFYSDKAKKKPFARLHFWYPQRIRKYDVNLLGYSQKYALVAVGDRNGSGSKLQLWDITVDCKHTDDHKWKSASNKEEICKKGCSFIRDTSAESITSEYYWHEATRTLLFMTCKGIGTIDLNSGEESFCEVEFDKYGEKARVYKLYYYTSGQSERILDVRVMSVNGVSTMFCHVQSINGDFFINLTTKRIHLFVDRKCPLTWISKNLKVAVISSQGDRMRVVSIAEEQPKVLAKYTFDKIKMTGVASSPEGYVLFVWSYDNQNGYGGPRPVTMRAYLWEVGYTLGQIKPVPPYSEHLPSANTYWVADEAGKRGLVMKGICAIDFNHRLNF